MLFRVRTPAFKADSRDGNPPYPDTGLYRGDPVGVSGDLGPSFDAYPSLLFPRVVGFLSLRCLSPSHASYFSIPRPEIIYDPFRNRYMLEEARYRQDLKDTRRTRWYVNHDLPSHVPEFLSERF